MYFCVNSIDFLFNFDIPDIKKLTDKFMPDIFDADLVVKDEVAKQLRSDTTCDRLIDDYEKEQEAEIVAYMDECQDQQFKWGEKY